MSVPNLTLVQELSDGVARRAVPAVLARLYPDVERQRTKLMSWGGHYRGHEGAREAFASS